MQSTDRIEKTIVLRAPVPRVWKAISTAAEFGRWFGIELDGELTPGATVRGTFVGDLNEKAVADVQRRLGIAPTELRLPGPKSVFCTVERIEPERYMSFRWVPFGIDAEADPAHEPTTLVEFVLEPVEGGTRLTVVESGFDRVPAHRRDRALRMNDFGWASQVENVRRHVEQG